VYKLTQSSPNLKEKIINFKFRKMKTTKFSENQIIAMLNPNSALEENQFLSHSKTIICKRIAAIFSFFFSNE